jgi:enoyl-CoA hydratase/carnithine racemase
MDQDQLLTAQNDNILTVTFNRPEKRNALTPDMLIALYKTLQTHAQKDACRAVIITGSGEKAFSSGYDITAIPTTVSPELETLLKKKSPFELAVDSIVNYPYPVIAMLNGFAFGGACDLAVACDIRIAADDIQMGMVPARLGMVYFPDGLQRFVRTIGLSRTKEMFFTARRYGARQLKEMGLLDYIVPREELARFSYAFAGEITENAPLSLKGTKRILNMIAESSRLEEAEIKEAVRLVENSFTSEDLKEGQAAFLEKRKARFQGK